MSGTGWARVLLDHAREMRRQPTPAEQMLWRALRAKALAGLKFRRQEPIGPYIVDFYCPPAKLVVELDGATHADSRTDLARDAWLATQGIRVMRVWNNDVMGNLDGVLRVIGDAATPPPCPLPQGEGEQRSSPPPLVGGGRGRGRRPGERP